jgi:uncharacterized ParB-like nuclease family protein
MAKQKPVDQLPKEYLEWVSRPITLEVPDTKLRVHDMLEWRRSPRFRKLRAQLFPKSAKQPEELILLIKDAGMEEFVGAVVWTLKTLSFRSNVKRSKKIVKVPVKRVLSKVWQFHRLRRIFEMYALGSQPPPVSLGEIRFGEESFYQVFDGNHRVEAAKIRGEEFIKAEIQSVFVFDPTDWILGRTGARHRDTGQTRKLEPDSVAAARWLGVPAS